MVLSLKEKIVLISVAFVSLVSFTKEKNDSYFSVNGSRLVTIPTNYFLAKGGLTNTKIITLMKIIPTGSMIEQNKTALKNRELHGGELDYSHGITPFVKSSGVVDLGMSNVPVLDQGSVGTCVTFATTGALDARFNLGDGIDQQCLLAFLKSFGANYWNGAIGPFQIFIPIQWFGFVPKGQCTGNSSYPDPGQTVYLWDYLKKSNKRDNSLISYSSGSGANLSAVKSALNAGSRVLAGMSLNVNNDDPVSISGFNVIVNGVHNSGGLWACQQSGNSSDYCAKQTDGHEVIIIGYDDNQQLLKIRNSWGANVGDQGDFYMTYDFFNAMIGDYTVLN